MRCRNSLELCPLLQWAAQQPQESINNIDLLWANNKHTHTQTHTRTWKKDKQKNGRREGKGEREERGSPLTPISLHSSVHWTSEWPLTTFPSILGHMHLQMEHVHPPHSHTVRRRHTWWIKRRSYRKEFRVRLISDLQLELVRTHPILLTCSVVQHRASCFLRI